MSSTASQLYLQWRDGDATAGARLVESIQDWFDAIAMGRLGAARGAVASSRAAERFRAGVGQLRGPAELVGWSHGLIADEVAREGSRLRQPLPGRGTEQLMGALAHLATAERTLLRTVYASLADAPPGVPPEALPLRLAAARDALKAALARDGARFTTAGVHPDHAPLAVYEAGRAGPDEESAIERWLLADLHARRDVVEFAPWAAALRAGLPEVEPPAGSVAPPTAPAGDTAGTGRDLSLAAEPSGGRKAWPWVLVALAALAAVAAWMLHG